ncbi:actin cortical patch SUR7/pH-response regulator pali [Chlamydoabsidia padenii]|nr:actin cortical patch SUR7/pH-response regulator pali [Chlamydoabsidia padenii]
MALFAFVATFTTFAALVLEIFTMIGNTYNKPFLRDLYFARLTTQGGAFIDFGLWNYCTGNNGMVDMCSQPKAAFVWTDVPQLSTLIQGFDGQDKVFLANFVLYWIAIGLTLFALVVTLLSHFRRSSDLFASLACFFSFVVMLVVFVILLVASLRGVNAAKSSSDTITGNLGPSMWMTLGAMCGLFLASIWYCISCCFGSGRVRDMDKA